MGLIVVLVVVGVVLPAAALVGAGLRSTRAPMLRVALVALGVLWAAAGVGLVVTLLAPAG